MDSSSFSDIKQTYPDAELLPVSGSTCECYRVKLYGKFHFMKRLKPELRTDPRYVSALQKEFETGYRLDHPHLVRYVSKGEDYLLTEYIDGENLKAFAISHPDYFKSRKNADRILSQLLDVVNYLHQHQIVHLDLKPENIIVTRIGHEVKLTDLGYCYTDTYTDTMGRTDKYAAPEQLSNNLVDARTDIYAIGKILQTLPCAHIYNKVIARCTADDPANRYQTVEELQNAMHTSSRLLLTGLALLLVILLFLGGRFIFSQHEPQVAPQPELQPKPVEQPLSTTPEIQDSVTPIKSATPQTKHNVSPEKPAPRSTSEQLKADIAAAVLPKFKATMGALPDSVKPGSEQWAQAGWALEHELSNTLQELILSHQDIPMQTIAQEYNSYLQSLITLKFNQNSKVSTP
jgi:serine/threonine protein kinase